MKLHLNSKTLTDTLSKLAQVIDSNPIVPILECYLISADAHADAISIVATNLSQTLTATVPLVGHYPTEPVQVCIPAKLLLDTLKALPDQPIVLQADSEATSIHIITANGNYNIATYNPLDYPKTNATAIGEVAGLLPAADMATAIKLTKVTVSKDQLRPAMTGVSFIVNDMSTTFAASDGNVLNQIQFNNMAFNDNANVIIPAKTMNVLAAILTDDEVNIHTDGKSITFGTSGMLLTSKLIDERFPNLDNIFPDPLFDLCLQRITLSECIKRVMNFANETTQEIELSITADGLVISASDISYGHEAAETIECKIDNHTYSPKEAEGFKVGFNAKFLLKMLSVLSTDALRLCITSPIKPVLIHHDTPIGTNYTGLIMPVILAKY